jgi:hypothetical protein
MFVACFVFVARPLQDEVTMLREECSAGSKHLLAMQAQVQALTSQLQLQRSLMQQLQVSRHAKPMSMHSPAAPRCHLPVLRCSACIARMTH